MPSSRTNWHEAITCAIQIDLRDYSHLLEYKMEHFLSTNRNRIDLLIIRKQLDIHIPKHIASLFLTHNIFEYKGLGTSLTADTYYKTNGHAGYYIDSFPGTNAINRQNLTLSFPTFHYPQKLFRHLTKECNKAIENPFPGVYYIKKEMYATQVLVIPELSPEDSLYLHCLTQNLNDQRIINNLSDDYTLHKNDALYKKYIDQLTNSHEKGAQLMISEGIFRLYGTSSKEIAQKAAAAATEKATVAATEKANREAEAKYGPQIEKLTLEKDTLASEIHQLTSELSKLKQLLAQHNIAY